LYLKFMMGLFYGSYRKKEENLLLVDRWTKEKQVFYMIAKAKLYIHYRHDKVLTGSFQYSTQQLTIA